MYFRGRDGFENEKLRLKHEINKGEIDGQTKFKAEKDEILSLVSELGYDGKYYNKERFCKVEKGSEIFFSDIISHFPITFARSFFTAEKMTSYKGSGMSVMEMCHRNSLFQSIIDEMEADLRELMNIPDDYEVLFLQGGTSLQFSMIPMNFMLNGKADYILTGYWAKKAYTEAKRYGEINIAASSEDKNYSYIPDCSDIDISDDADYIYMCENNTIYGTKFKRCPNGKGKFLVNDVFSSFLSEPMNVSDYGMIFGGVQKNLAPAGLVIAIIHKSLISENVMKGTPTMLRYKTHADSKSLYNTPPTYNIYIVGKVIKWIKALGGLDKMQEINKNKAAILYDYLDKSAMFHGFAEKEAVRL